MTFLAENLGTILISLLLILIVTAIIRKLIRDKKRGVSCCGGSCGHCAKCGACRISGKHA